MFAPAGIVDMLARFVFSDAFQFEFFRKPHRKETLQLEVQLLGLISNSEGVSFVLGSTPAFAEGLGLDAGELLGEGDAGVLDVFVRVFPRDDVEVAVALR